DHKHLLSSFRTLHQRRLHREREHREREELLTRRFTTNAEAHRAQNDTQIDLGVQEYFDQERSKLTGFNRHVDEMISTGSNVLHTLRHQRSMLKTTRKNILDTLNSIGLSNSVMRLIEKRHIGDKFVLFGVREFIDLAKEVANMNEEQSLGFLTALDFQLKECMQILGQLSFAPQPMDYAERAHIERFIFTEHKLDMIKVMINDDDIVNKLFYMYYTKQNRPPSVSEVLMINREGKIFSVFEFVFKLFSFS
ncbi:Golgi SNAP receptor complex member 2-like protein, partial [Euroglyphus maynei]